jgi:hypothetical protein
MVLLHPQKQVGPNGVSATDYFMPPIRSFARPCIRATHSHAGVKWLVPRSNRVMVAPILATPRPMFFEQCGSAQLGT